MLFRNCPVCGADSISSIKLGVLTPTNEYNRFHSDFVLLRCIRCDLVYLTPLPKKEVFDNLYINNKQFYNCQDYIGERAKIAIAFYKSRLDSMLNEINANLSANKLKILEIGAGVAWISRAMKEINKNCLTIAQDITNECEHTCDWVNKYVVGEIDEKINVLKQDAPYNIISLTHVIEHLPNPIQTLKLLIPLLDDKGVIFMTAPHRPKNWDIDTTIENWRNWSYNHVPAHLQYFNHKSLSKLSALLNLKIAYYDDSSEEGQSLEVWLRK